MADMQEVVGAWSEYLATVDNWEALVGGIEPKVGGWLFGRQTLSK